MLKISVIVPTYNRLSRLKQVIAALERQQYPLQAFEVIIISDGSTDGTHAYLEQLITPLRLQWAVQQNRGPAAARNNGVARAMGELVVFIDDDMVPEPQLLAEHVRAHAAAGREVVVLGPMLTPADFAMAPWVCWEQAMLMKQYEAMERGDWPPTARQFYTGNTSLRRHHILAAGGFNENFRRAEDVELAYRLAEAGVGFVFCPQAAGMHYAERSFRSWLEIPYAYGRNDVLFARNHRQTWIMQVARREFGERHSLIRGLARACLGRRRLSAATTAGLKLAASLAGRLGAARTAQFAYSGLFSLRYYQGFCDELGDPGFFFRAPDSMTATS